MAHPLHSHPAMTNIDTLAAAFVATARELDAARAAYDANPSDETFAAWDRASEAHDAATAAYYAAL